LVDDFKMKVWACGPPGTPDLTNDLICGNFLARFNLYLTEMGVKSLETASVVDNHVIAIGISLPGHEGHLAFDEGVYGVAILTLEVDTGMSGVKLLINVDFRYGVADSLSRSQV
jgi:hypothetical protein